jgi:hypothetical protein
MKSPMVCLTPFYDVLDNRGVPKREFPAGGPAAVKKADLLSEDRRFAGLPDPSYIVPHNLLYFLYEIQPINPCEK